MSVENPVDGEVIEFWKFTTDGGGRPYIEHRRAVFHADMAPRTFLSPERDEPGMWHIEELVDSPPRWNGTGWSERGWLVRRLANLDTAGYVLMFFTEEKAVRDYAIEWCNGVISTMQRQVNELVARRDRIIAGGLG